MTVNKMYIFGDQLVSSPGPYNGQNNGNYNVEPGAHWWERLADDLKLEPVHIGKPTENVQISQWWWLDQYLSILGKLKAGDRFCGPVPSAYRSLEWGDRGPQHKGSLKPGIHHYEDFACWQNQFTYKVINRTAPKDNCCFIMEKVEKTCGFTECNADMVKTTKTIKVIDQNTLNDMNWFWSWVVTEGKAPLASWAGEFYQHYAPDRKLNAKGHEAVYKAVKKYVH